MVSTKGTRMLSTILVPLDGSPLAELALAHAERLAEATSARLVLARVLPVYIIQPPQDDLASAEDARGYLERVATRLMARGRDVKTSTVWGGPVDMILERVRATQADLVLMATHGRSGPGRWLYGSVADQVLRRSPVPVMLVPPRSTSAWPADRAPKIILPLDGSKLAEAALQPVADLAASLGSEVVLVQVIPFPPYSLYADDGAYLAAFDCDAAIAGAQDYLAGVATRLRSTVRQVRARAELGQPTEAIAKIARQEGADLITMTTHGRSGLARLVLGSVATATLRRTEVPMILIRPASLDGSLTADEPVAVAAG
jgi:nucleotide-binding universal stress UspA family protein